MEPFDTDSFIAEIQAEPAIWDCKSDSYSNRIEKAKAWEKICGIFHNNFQELSTNEKNKIAVNLQKKWKSLRDSFNRELKTLKKVETGKGASKRKKYIYFEQLLFLEPLAQQRETTSNLETGDVGENPDNAAETQIEVSPSSNNTKQKKRKCDKEDELIKILQQRIITNEEPNKDKNISQDDDTLFCLSLVSDFKKFLDDMKTDAKCEVLQVLNKYKRLSAPVYGYSTQNVPHNNLGHSSQKAQYNNFDPIVTSSVYNQQAYANTHVPSTSGMAQHQHQSVPQMPKNFPPRSPVCSTSTVAQPQRFTQTQTSIHIPLTSPTYSSVSSPDSLNTFSEQGYEDISQDTQDSIITQLF